MSKLHRLIEQEIPRLRRYARALTRNPERADDLVQDTLARAILALYHLAQPECKRGQARPRESAAVDVGNCSAVLVATTDPTASRQLHELDCAIAQLPEVQRQVILLVGLEGMSYEHAAAILNLPVGTIRSRLSRGCAALRHLMDMEVKLPRGVAVRKLIPKHSAASLLARVAYDRSFRNAI
jgi:RNA polymerase sigma-70 factor (ECF subfamily)